MNSRSMYTKKVLQVLKVAAVASMVLVLSGCYMTSTPKNLVASVAESVRKNDYQAYLAMLSPIGRAKLGSPKAFKELQMAVAKAKGHPSLGSTLISKSGNYEYGLSTVHHVTIFLDSKAVADARVSCYAKRTYRPVRHCHSKKRSRCHTDWEPTITTDCSLDGLNL